MPFIDKIVPADLTKDPRPSDPTWGIRATLVLKNDDPHSMFDQTVEAADRTTRARSISKALHQLELDVMYRIASEGIEEDDILDVEFHLHRIAPTPPTTTPVSSTTNAPTDSPTAYPRPDFRPSPRS